MQLGDITQRLAPVAFTGRRRELFGLLLRGYLLMLPTLGIYRFWRTTWKRRFYWRNTVIDGDPLEYTGSALQLLIGFLFALAFFLPIYIAFFYLSTQSTEIALIGYGAVATLIWFMTGYAIYRARDFRLSRTLWRGIRFDQRGSAMGYAVRRFFWSILVVATLGLAYPFMAGNLWKYRYRHTWFGDRQFGFAGSWKTIAGPYYKLYFLNLAMIIATIVAGFSGGFVLVSDIPVPAWPLLATGGATLLVIGLGYFYFRSREATRMFSCVRVGDAAITVKVRARALFGQFFIYSLCVIAVLVAFIVLAGFLIVTVFSGSLTGDGGAADLARILQSGWLNASILILGYLAFLASLGLLSEVFLGFGYWMLVARGAVISNPDSLRTVRATNEDMALAGEGLADALNVGAY